jgi:hypothetical protein
LKIESQEPRVTSTQEGGHNALTSISRELIAKAEATDSPQGVVLDMEYTEIPVYSRQSYSTCNGRFGSTCCQSTLFNREGDCLAPMRLPTNIDKAEDWEELSFPEAEWQEKLDKEVSSRADVAFAEPEIYDALEEPSVKYAIRVPGRDSVERDIAAALLLPGGSHDRRKGSLTVRDSRRGQDC